MTYNVLGGTLNFTLSIYLLMQLGEIHCEPEKLTLFSTIAVTCLEHFLQYFIPVEIRINTLRFMIS